MFPIVLYICKWINWFWNILIYDSRKKRISSILYKNLNNPWERCTNKSKSTPNKISYEAIYRLNVVRLQIHKLVQYVPINPCEVVGNHWIKNPYISRSPTRKSGIYPFPREITAADKSQKAELLIESSAKSKYFPAFVAISYTNV